MNFDILKASATAARTLFSFTVFGKIFSLLMVLVTGIGYFISKFLSPSVVRQLSILTLITGFSVAVVLFIKESIYSLLALVDTSILGVVLMVMPPHFPLCFSLIVSAQLARWVLSWKIYFLQTMFQK